MSPPCHHVIMDHNHSPHIRRTTGCNPFTIRPPLYKLQHQTRHLIKIFSQNMNHALRHLFLRTNDHSGIIALPSIKIRGSLPVFCLLSAVVVAAHLVCRCFHDPSLIARSHLLSVSLAPTFSALPSLIALMTIYRYSSRLKSEDNLSAKHGIVRLALSRGLTHLITSGSSKGAPACAFTAHVRSRVAGLLHVPS